MDLKEENMAPIKWKRGQHVSSDDGRFVIEGHWDQKPGFYLLRDTHTYLTERGVKLRDLKAKAQAIVDSGR